MQIWKYKKCPAQMEHATHTQEESERALNERILKLEGRRIQLEEVGLFPAVQLTQTHPTLKMAIISIKNGIAFTVHHSYSNALDSWVESLSISISFLWNQTSAGVQIHSWGTVLFIMYTSDCTFLLAFPKILHLIHHQRLDDFDENLNALSCTRNSSSFQI